MDQQQPVTITQPIKLLQERNCLQQLIPQVLVILEPFLLITHQMILIWLSLGALALQGILAAGREKEGELATSL